jgi:hypothetical protein
MEILGYPHHVCLACRRSKKGPRYRTVPLTCAECGGTMHRMGKLFAAPRRQDESGWRKIEWMIANGWNGRNWPVSPQMSLSEVQEVVRSMQEQSTREDRRREKMQRNVVKGRAGELRSYNAKRASKRLVKQRQLEEARQRLYQDGVLEQVTRATQAASLEN